MGTPAPSGPPPPPPPMFATELVSSDPRRTRTFRAVDQIRTSITIYLLVPLFEAIYAIIVTAVLLTTTAFVVGNFGGSGVSGVIESDSPVIAIPGELLAFVTLILTIVAWITWRRGVRELAEDSGEYGAAQVGASRQARKDYGYTVYTWIAQLVFGIAVAVVLILVLLDAILSNINSGQPNSTAAANALGSALGLIVVVALISLVITILLYHFASRSLAGAIGAVASPALRARLQRARTTILAGAVLGVLAQGTILARDLYGLAIVSPLVLAVGFLMMRSAYSEWLAAPPTPSAAATASVTYVSVGSFPPPPPPG